MAPSTATRALFSLTLGALCVSRAAAQDHSSEASEAGIANTTLECTPYGYQPVTNAIVQFPPIWEIATIVDNDATAAAKWASIQPNVPDIAPKNISLNITAAVGGADYSHTDPDCWWSFAKCTTPKLSGLVADISSVPEPNTLGYGFDDGPNCGHNVFYDFLTAQNQKATMYYIGSNVMNFPLEAQRAIVDGHEICAHTWSHKYMTSLDSESAFAELYYSMQAIKLVTGVTPTCWRPPYGDVDDRIRSIAHGLGLITIIWTYDSNDWQFGSNPNITIADVDANYQNLINNATNGTFATEGTIILTHELNNFTMTEAIKFYPMLKTAFTHITPVGVALNITSPYLEQEYALPSFAQYIAGTTTTGANTINANDTVIPTLVAGSTPSITAGATGDAAGVSGSTTGSASSSSATTGTTSSASHAVLHAGALALVAGVAGALAVGL
ncbi:carbohydrate esterase family 4 protein [Hypholoma sublateritium FD-334 SS-4]|uniref:chitin deacetylase n=1 Tax=Hypholoma sublateritium (strain FD-334 SS-4) TaxID=945553 RepID=A0A0D2NG42_HYPSF|nr:carbohydrate esterase family 4 protein [Hypholoma sublateritium FD-334 SS-4]